MTNVIGQVFSPCFMTEAEFEEGYKNSEFYVEKDYYNEYRKHMIAMEHIANIAKSYIFNNWKKVEDWSDLDVKIRAGNTGIETHYYKYVAHESYYKGSAKIENFFEKIRREEEENQKPIQIFNDVVLDPTDGDFSVTINDTAHWWINDDAIITIADYIEKKLVNN